LRFQGTSAWRPSCLQNGNMMDNLASMLRSLISVVFLGLVGAACSSPVCGVGFTEIARRCEVELIVKQCSEPCSADAHEVCDTSLEEPECVCAPGYESTPCEWAGVPADPGFQALVDDEDVPYWSTMNGATVLPFETNTPIDAGAAFLAPSVVCNAGNVSQVVEMPPYEAAEPLVAEVTYRAREVHGMAVGFNDAWKTLPPTQDDVWETARFCLGEAAYGGPVLFQVASSERLITCFQDPVGNIDVDHFAVIVAADGECPVPGEVVNGEAVVAQEGWVFTTEGTAEAGLVDGVGRGGTSGVRLANTTSQGNRAVATTQVSVPLPSSLPSPALRFWWKGNSGRLFPIEIGTFVTIGEQRRALDWVLGNGSELNYIYCLPPWTHGNVVDLSFKIIADDPTAATELVVDDVEVVSDTKCGDSPVLLDPGFESAPNRLAGVTHASKDQSLTMRSDSGLARSGDGVLELSYWTTEAFMFVESFVLVPQSNGSEGPALIFYSKVPAAPAVTPKWVLGKAAQKEADLPKGGDWRRNEVCLPPEWADRWFRFRLQIGPELGPIVPLDSPEEMYFDDFELTTLVGCPAD
jgi:hypothetical protein